MLHHSPPQPEPSLVQLLVVRRDVAKPDIASEEDLQVPVLVEGDQVTDVSVAHIGLLCQHSCHEDVVNSEDSFIAVLEGLGTGHISDKSDSFPRKVKKREKNVFSV